MTLQTSITNVYPVNNGVSLSHVSSSFRFWLEWPARENLSPAYRVSLYSDRERVCKAPTVEGEQAGREYLLSAMAAMTFKIKSMGLSSCTSATYGVIFCFVFKNGKRILQSRIKMASVNTYVMGMNQWPMVHSS